MSLLVALPILIPLAAFPLGLLSMRTPRRQAAVALVVALALPLVGGILLDGAVRGHVWVLEVGGWPPPFGIALVVDRFAALMVLLTGVVALAATLTLLVELPGRERPGALLPLIHLLLAGVGGAFVTGDLFNLYVWFEVMLIASFVLLGLGRGTASSVGTLKYVVLNLIASTLFLAGAGVVYALTRTLSLADLSRRMPELAAVQPELVLLAAGLFFVAFGIKSGLFPLFFWLPPSYPTLPVGVSALFAGLLTKVGVFAFVRIWTLLFTESPVASEILTYAAVATMLAGVFGAVSAMHVRRILGFHIVSQIGYIVVGVGLLAADDPSVRRMGLAAAIFYTAHHIVVKSNLFLAAGIVRRLRGGERLGLGGGLMESAPWFALLFAIPAASLAGIPPLSGFWAKLAVLEAAFAAESYGIAIIALVAGLFTLASMVKIWTHAFWGEAPAPGAATSPGGADERRTVRRLALPMALLALLTLALGVAPGPLLAFAEAAADQLLDAEAYRAALGVTR